MDRGDLQLGLRLRLPRLVALVLGLALREDVLAPVVELLIPARAVVLQRRREAKFQTKSVNISERTPTILILKEGVTPLK